MKKSYKIYVDCANCAAKMENAAGKVNGVTKATVSFMTQRMTLETEGDDQSAVLQDVIKACKKVEPDCEIYI